MLEFPLPSSFLLPSKLVFLWFISIWKCLQEAQAVQSSIVVVLQASQTTFVFFIVKFNLQLYFLTTQAAIVFYQFQVQLAAVLLNYSGRNCLSTNFQVQLAAVLLNYSGCNCFLPIFSSSTIFFGVYLF